MTETVANVISTLNSIHVGDLDRIRDRLEEARTSLVALEQRDLVETLEDASLAIGQGDVPRFRKRVQHVVSRLGHLR